MQVSIRPLEVKDAYTSYKWRNDKEVFKYTGNVYSTEITLETELSWINRVISNKNEYRCAIIVDGNYVGNIYLTDIDGVSAEYQIFIGEKNYWSKGVAKQASQLILTHAFDVLKLNRVYLSVRHLNVPAIALYEKLGFVRYDTNNSFIMMHKFAPPIYIPENQLNIK